MNESQLRGAVASLFQAPSRWRYQKRTIGSLRSAPCMSAAVSVTETIAVTFVFFRSLVYHHGHPYSLVTRALQTTHLPILPLTAILYVAAKEQPDVTSHQLNSLAGLLDKVTQEAATQFILQPQYTDNFQNICEGALQMHFKVAVRNFHALSAGRWFSHRCSEGCQGIAVVRWTGQLPLGLPYAISLHYQSKTLIITVSPVCRVATLWLKSRGWQQ